MIYQEAEIIQKAVNHKGAEIPAGEENPQEARNSINMEGNIAIVQEHPIIAPVVHQAIIFRKTQDSIPLRLKEEVLCKACDPTRSNLG